MKGGRGVSGWFHARDVGEAGHSWGASGGLKLGATDRRLKDEARFFFKRVLDVAASLLLLTLSLPVFVVVGAAIKLNSRGPIIFVQHRAGSRRIVRGGQVWWEPQTFRCYKFRSMVVGGGDAAHRMHIRQFVEGTLQGVNGSTVKLTGDSRVTLVGQVLRRTSLDELPQLFNVLIGDMSLVGPRPVPLYEVAEYDLWHFERLAARPGITGLWQVYGRGRVGFAEMIRMDIDYVRRPSMTADLKLLAQTVPAVLAGKGAY